MKQGYVQVYTGDVKGKTTAAVGLAMRAAAAGLRVVLLPVHEVRPHRRARCVSPVRRPHRGGAVRHGRRVERPDPEDDAQAARRGLAAAREAVLGGAFDVVVLDEANVADSLGYFEPDALVDLALERPETVELVVTGRGASGTLMAVADLVTEMREVKHYYEEGVIARRGIEF
ncbi:MAG: cob(I)yrinic acid a,c-diamide adenosyltransferase [Eggerthella lenta]